jgi:hypothetical protein
MGGLQFSMNHFETVEMLAPQYWPFSKAMRRLIC